MLLKMLDERKISYLGSMVLGINDAMVELTGALAGLTFALENARVTGFAGFIAGIAASLSMASSEYLSKKSEGGNPVRAAFYTGMAYLITVILLIFPYFLLNDYRMAFFLTICMAIFVIYIFTFFIAVVKDMIFWKLFMDGGNKHGNRLYILPDRMGHQSVLQHTDMRHVHLIKF